MLVALAMVVLLQHAMTIRGYQPGRMAWLEKAIHHVLNGLVDRIFDGEASRPSA